MKAAFAHNAIDRLKNSLYLNFRSRFRLFNKSYKLLLVVITIFVELRTLSNAEFREAAVSESHWERSKHRRLNIHRHRARIRSLLRCGGRFSNKRTSLTSSLSSQQYRRLVVHQLRRRRTRRSVYRYNPVARISDAPPLAASDLCLSYHSSKHRGIATNATSRRYVCGTKRQSKRTN